MPRVDVIVDKHGNITCDPNKLKIGKTQGSVVIKWKMQSDGWEVTGITDPDGNPLSTKRFKDSRKDKKDKKKWRIRDMNDKIKDYEYVVHVKSTKTGECKAHDPMIRNGGRKM